MTTVVRAGAWVAWFDDPDPVVASAGWAQTADRVDKQSDGLDLTGLLDIIEVQMKDAPERRQWAMNTCLAQIGVEHPELRACATEISERLEVLKDYPTPPNSTAAFAWLPPMDPADPIRSNCGCINPVALDEAEPSIQVAMLCRDLSPRSSP